MKTPHSEQRKKSSFILPLTLTLALTTLSLTTITAQKINTTAAAASARTRTKWYIVGGTISTKPGDPSSSQFLSLDLSVPWTVAAPAWGFPSASGSPSQALFPATFSADEQNLFVYHLPGGPKVGQYNVAQDTWVDSKYEFAGYEKQGIGVVTDTNTGYIYVTGGYSDMTLSSVERYHPDRPSEPVNKFPFPPETSFVARWYMGNVFCKPRNSILYFGGYTGKTELITQANVVTQFNITSSQFSTLQTSGATPAIRADHCMGINEDGSKVVVYGGRLTNGLTGSLYILDTNTLVWTSGEAGEARTYPSCTIVGDQVIVWGGKNAAPGPGLSEVIAVDPLFIYSISKNVWVKNFTPLSGATATTTVSGISGTGTTGKPGSPTETGAEKSSNSAAIIGGVVGAVVVIGAVVGFLLWRRRKQLRDGSRKKKKLFITKPPTPRSPNSDPDENNGLDSADYLMTTAAAAAASGTGGFDTPSKSSNNPQTAMETNPELEWKMRDIENQQKQLDLKRQLLVLQQQEQQLRGPLPLLSVSSLGPQTASAGAPVTANVPFVKAGTGGGGVFGDKRQSSYEVHALQNYPTPLEVSPPTTRQTVHTLPEHYTTHPQQQGDGMSPLSNTSTVRPGSEMYQNTAEPTYGPSPVNVPSSYPGLEYQEGAVHNGVGWVRLANGPHAVLDRDLGQSGSVIGVGVGGVQQQQGGKVGGYHN
ncbi:hypothetical protein BGX24_001240 [Mortierella sp. AD032]|nr:hypothetical protein BGX24_001240 [Mortierella sp. AD032]